jgi:hypothetical protein
MTIPARENLDASPRLSLDRRGADRYPRRELQTGVRRNGRRSVKLRRLSENRRRRTKASPGERQPANSSNSTQVIARCTCKDITCDRRNVDRLSCWVGPSDLAAKRIVVSHTGEPLEEDYL